MQMIWAHNQMLMLLWFPGDEMECSLTGTLMCHLIIRPPGNGSNSPADMEMVWLPQQRNEFPPVQY